MEILTGIFHCSLHFLLTCMKILIGVCFIIVLFTSCYALEYFSRYLLLSSTLHCVKTINNSGKHLDHKFLLENGEWQKLFASPVHRW